MEKNYRASPERVKLARVKCGMTQKKFAESLYVGLRTMQGYEQGKRKPNGLFSRIIYLILKH